MFSKFTDEKTTSNSMTDNSSKINNSSNPFNTNQSALVKLNVEDADKDLDFNEDDIDKIEKKLGKIKDLDLFSRENQISKAVDEIIEVPKKIIKDELNILSDDKKQNRIKEQMREKEQEQEQKQRKIEMEINSKKMKKYKDKVKIYNLEIKRKNLLLIAKYLLIIVIISISIITLIILIDKYK